MNAIIENLLTRRSTRAFLQKEIPDNELNEILQAAIYAPSGMGKQTWKFTVLCNQEKIQQLAELIGRKLGRKGYDMYRPQVLIIPSNQKENPHGMEDNACALENIFLAAHPSESVLSGSISSAHSVMILKSVLCLMSLKFLPIMSYTEWLLWDIRQTRPKRKSTKSERSGLSNKTDRRFYR